MKFSKLFSKKDNRIDALRAAIETNAQERAWATSFIKRREELESKLRDARNEFAGQPSDAAAEKCIELARELNSLTGQMPVLSELSKIAWEYEKPKQMARLRDAICPALDAVIEALQAEASRIDAGDKERAAALGVEAHDVKSPILARVGAAIGTGQQFRDAIAKGDDGRIAAAIRYVLDGHEATPKPSADISQSALDQFEPVTMK